MNINVQPSAAAAAAFGPTWFADTKVSAPVRPRLALDADVDVCVIGGGLAGLTAAREIARRGWSVVVLEAQRIAWNASGRNCGIVVPGFGQTEEKIVERVGLDDARALWKLSEEGVEYVRKAIRGEKMRGVDPAPGWLGVSRVEAADQVARRAALLKDVFNAKVEGWSTDEVRAVLKSSSYFQGLHFPRAFAVHSLNYALRLAEAAEAAGARIYEETPALSIDPAGVRKRIVTPSARVRSAHIVLAGNVHLGRLMQRLHETLLPVWAYAIVTDPIGSVLAESIAYPGGVSDGDGTDYRIVGGDRLLWSGGITTWGADPRRFADRLTRDIRRTFPQLGDVGVSHAWSGVFGRTVHRMPQIGELSPGLWVASGFGGHGLNTTAMAGSLIARGIVERDAEWRRFIPFELIWAGRTLGRAAAQLAYWSFRGRDRIAARASRMHEQLLPPRRRAGDRIEAREPPLPPEPPPPAVEVAVPPADGPDTQPSVNPSRAKARTRNKKSATKAAPRERSTQNRGTNRRRRPVVAGDEHPSGNDAEAGGNESADVT